MLSRHSFSTVSMTALFFLIVVLMLTLTEGSLFNSTKKVSKGASGSWCLNEAGEPVDWWMVVKVSRQRDSSNNGVATGTAYLYGDAQSYRSANFWKSSKFQVTDGNSAPGLTLQQIYDNSDNSEFGYQMYNDEIPNGATSMSYGHTKGMLSWSASGGFWLIHSVPKYADTPDNTDTYEYPSTGEQYGQSMLCMSLDLPNVDKAFLQFQYTNPQVYGSQWVKSLTSKLPNGDAFVNQGQVVTTASSHVINITTSGGFSTTHFAKTTAWGQSIFGNLIGPYYQQSLLVESWQRPYEDPLLPPTYQDAIYSVLTLQCPPNANWDGVTWKMTQDHAKWTVSADGSLPLICIGDINKQQSQWKRSGGMACIVDQTIYSNWAALIATTDQNNKAPRALVAETYQPLANQTRPAIALE